MSTPQEFLSTIKTYTTCLGQGAFGIVLKGIDESDTPSAVKFLFPVDYSDRDKLRREYQVAKDLQHENIVLIIKVEERKLTLSDVNKIFKDLPSNEKLTLLSFSCREKISSSYSKTIESICIKMELCGSNLRRWLNQGHDPDELHIQIRQTRIVQGMITGLKFLHSNKIIHRDLKPENIMFSRGRYQLPVKIGDFGHSRLIHSEDSRTGPMTDDVGTLVYMAPEVSSGKYDQQADLFSLGLIILEVAQLIWASSRRSLFDKLVNDREEDLVKDHPIMTGIKELIVRLTKRKTADRTKSLDQINTEAAWEAALVQEVTRKGCKPVWDAITTTFDNNWTAKTSEEFKLCLDNVKEGCTINLMAGEYPVDRFILWESGIKIVGNGTRAVLRRVYSSRHIDFLVIFGNQCTISGVKIIIDTRLRESHMSGIVLNGDMNTIKNVEMTQITSSMYYAGIKINGSHNTVDHVFLNNLQHWGILVEPNSNSNTISNITGVDLGGGIWIHRSSNNTLSDIKLAKRKRGGEDDGVHISSFGSSNTVSNLTCRGYFRKNDRVATTWDLSFDTPNTTVKDCQCGSVLVWAENATLTNVDCGELIQIDPRVAGVKLINCRGNKLEASDNVGVIDCQFEEITAPE